jgi:alanine dehydrogenase
MAPEVMMKIGLVRELKDRENRVGLTPDGVRVLVEEGHQILVEQGAGLGSGFADDDYQRAGADLSSASTAWDSELVV